MYSYFPSMKCRSDAGYIEGIAKYLSKPFIIVSPSKNGHENSPIKMFKEIGALELHSIGLCGHYINPDGSYGEEDLEVSAFVTSCEHEELSQIQQNLCQKYDVKNYMDVSNNNGAKEALQTMLSSRKSKRQYVFDGVLAPNCFIGAILFEHLKMDLLHHPQAHITYKSHTLTFTN